MDSIVTALGLLEAGNACRIGGVRKYAVLRLKQASDSDLELYLLQLVQVRSFFCFSIERIIMHYLRPSWSILVTVYYINCSFDTNVQISIFDTNFYVTFY